MHHLVVKDRREQVFAHQLLQIRFNLDLVVFPDILSVNTVGVILDDLERLYPLEKELLILGL